MDEPLKSFDATPLRLAPRIQVIGSSCAGKSTFARRLAGALDARHVELDALHWLPGWQERSDEEFLALVAEAAAGPRWVMDGNYRMVRDAIWPRATALVWLNYSFATVWSRAIRRSLFRLFTNEELYSGNRESWRKTFFSGDSILWWVLSTYRRRRREFRNLFDSPSDAAPPLLFELRHPREAERFLQSLARTDIDMAVERGERGKDKG